MTARKKIKPNSYSNKPTAVKQLAILFGDQLDKNSSVFQQLDPQQDAILMMEVMQEATYIPQHKQKLTLFFSTMRHFTSELREKGFYVFYSHIDDSDNTGSFSGEIRRCLESVAVQSVLANKPGDYRVLEMLRTTIANCNVPLKIIESTHFYDTFDSFADFASDRSNLILEYYYRHMRRKHDILIVDGKPAGGHWNYDKDNRKSLNPSDVNQIKTPRAFKPDALTEEVKSIVEKEFASSPGRLEHFDYPVTRKQALTALRGFIKHRLAQFGDYQDAMLTDQPYLYHSRLSCSLNLQLISPHEVVDAVLTDFESGKIPINAAEGFVRQILGWREFIRGVYWRNMPEYASLNTLDANLPMPAFMWTAETEMNCVRHCVSQLIDHAYAHHIQRLMVLGLFGLLLGVRPYDVHRWHMSMYIDAVDWVSLPNVLGMSQYADGGIISTKPYCASGNYINKMSNYCSTCRFNPRKATGDDACPITTLYWDFLARHREDLKTNRRMQFQISNLNRKDNNELKLVRKKADDLKRLFTEKIYLSTSS